MSAKKSKSKKIEYDGYLYYYRYGFLHNDKGPAVVDTIQNIFEYRLFGKIHRIDGPAVFGKDSLKNTIDEEWWLNGKRYEFEEWCKNTPLDKHNLAMLVLQYA